MTGDTGGLGIAVVPGNANDHAFVYATWLNSYRKLGEDVRSIPSEVYFPAQHDRIERLLARCRLDVAVPEGEAGGLHTILGYAVTEGATLHWVYVKGSWRRMGIARRLLPVGLEGYSHRTSDLEHLKLNLKFNPYAAE